ncbi:MAG: hypothetical protein AAF471_09250, partial [Myxococcota bacterium]
KDLAKLDKRTYQRCLAKGTLTEKQWSEYTRKLPDVGDNAEPVRVGELLEKLRRNEKQQQFF